MAQWTNALTELQCSEPDWLAQWRGFDCRCCRHVESGFCMLIRLNSRASTEGSPESSFKSDRPSHPDWGRLGVVRAAVQITDGRGQRSYRRAAIWHPARETRQLSWAL